MRCLRTGCSTRDTSLLAIKTEGTRRTIPPLRVFDYTSHAFYDNEFQQSHLILPMRECSRSEQLPARKSTREERDSHGQRVEKTRLPKAAWLCNEPRLLPMAYPGRRSAQE